MLWSDGLFEAQTTFCSIRRAAMAASLHVIRRASVSSGIQHRSPQLRSVRRAPQETRGVDGYVSLGREGKAARPRDPGKYPATNRMAEKLSKPAGRAVTPNASGCRRLRTAGSNTCSDSGASDAVTS